MTVHFLPIPSLKMQVLLIVTLCAATAYAQSYANLRFDHPVMGKMMVSKKKFPLLTPVDKPEIVYVTPSTQQLQQINAPTTGRRRRQTPLDPAFRTKVKNFLTAEFGSTVTTANLPPIDESDLPFQSFGMSSDFEMIQIPKETYKEFMTYYQIKLANKQKSAPWFPATEIYDQLNICPFVYYDKAGSQAVQFDSSNGGVMAYFKISCTLDFPTNTVVVGLEYYGTNFKLQPIAKPTKITQEWNSLFGTAKQTMTTYMYQNRSLTSGQIRLLLDFLQGLVLRNVRSKFSSYLA